MITTKGSVDSEEDFNATNVESRRRHRGLPTSLLLERAYEKLRYHRRHAARILSRLYASQRLSSLFWSSAKHVAVLSLPYGYVCFYRPFEALNRHP